MDSAEVRRRYGRVFESVAEEYDRERRAYPDELVDAMVAEAGLRAGSCVLEVGCGTGKLTEQLVARGLVVRALDPGEEMVRVARRRVGAAASVRFEVERFEEVDVSPGYPMVCSATAWHWLDPAISWRQAHAALVPGGQLCLLQEVGIADERAMRDTELLQAAFEQAAPELARGWPVPGRREAVLAGVRERQDDVSAVWTWLTNYDLQDPIAPSLFDDVRVQTVPVLVERTAERFNAYFRTTSFHARLEPAQRARLEEENRRAAAELGGVLRLGTLAVLVTARRVG